MASIAKKILEYVVVKAGASSCSIIEAWRSSCRCFNFYSKRGSSPALISRNQFKEIVNTLIDWETHLPDAADKLLCKICRLDHAPACETSRCEGDLFYMPTPIRSIEAVIQAGHVKENDIFVDVGCGPGARIPVYVQLRTGAATVGVELYQDYYEHAEETAKELALDDAVNLVHCDAIDYDYHYGTVFYLFRPVEGEKFQVLLEKLARERVNQDTVVIAGGGSEFPLMEHPDFEWVDRIERGGLHVFRTGSSGESPQEDPARKDFSCSTTS